MRGTRRCPHLEAELVAFPDDDCAYPSDLLERVVARFAAEPELGILSGRAAAADGATAGRWPRGPAAVTPDTVWHAANSHTIFLRRSAVERVGGFDEALGLGAGTAWSSGEEIDYLVRALRLGVRMEYDPSLVVTHPVKPVTAEELVALGRRDGASVGYVLARNGYPVSHDRPDARAPRPRGRRSRSRSSTARGPGSTRRRSPVGSAVCARGHERREDRRVALEPVGEREPLDRPRTRSPGVALAVGEDRRDGSRERLGRRRLVPLVAVRMGDPDARPRRPTSSTVPPLAGYATGRPHAIASITAVGQGSFTFVWSSTCARRSIPGASVCA